MFSEYNLQSEVAQLIPCSGKRVRRHIFSNIVSNQEWRPSRTVVNQSRRMTG